MLVELANVVEHVRQPVESLPKCQGNLDAMQDYRLSVKDETISLGVRRGEPLQGTCFLARV